MTWDPTRAQPKGERRDQAAARRRGAEERARRACVRQVFARDGSRCRACGRRVRTIAEADGWWELGHVHEVTPRSGGGDPTDPTDCLLLCPECHMPGGAHGNRPRMVCLDPGLGTAGRVAITWRDGRRVVSSPRLRRT